MTSGPLPIRTPRLRLRQWRDADVDAFARLDFDHPAVPQGSPLRRHCLYRARRNDGSRDAAA